MELAFQPPPAPATAACGALWRALRSLLALVAGAAALAATPRQHSATGDSPAPSAGGRPVFPPAPAGFDGRRENIARGAVETAEYDSASVGARRKMVVYTPPGYSKAAQYPVLYLLHGIGDDETGWTRKGLANIILDNLLADGRIVPMIVVMPNGRASTNLTASSPWDQQFPVFADFEQDRLKDLIPCVESRYSVKKGRANRALAGLSMGGGQSLNFGLGHLDTFAWVGGFSSAPNTKPADQLVTDPAAAKQLKLLWLSCGDKDGLLGLSRKFHARLEEMKVPHIWHIDSGAHAWPVWKNDLYLLSQQLFR
jgi:enterochelin esterase-like enzyme